MSLSSSPTRLAARTSPRALLIPLVVLVTTAVLAFLFSRHFDTAVTILAPAFLCGCLLLLAGGLAHWLMLVRKADRHTMTRLETAGIVDQLADGMVPREAAAIGSSWQTMAIARAIARGRDADAVENVRAGLRLAGAGANVAARAQRSRSKWERVRAIYDLGWLGEKDALPLLYRSVADPDDDVAWAAVVALGSINDPVADEVLLELLEDGRFAPSRIAEVLDTSTYDRPVSVLRERARASGPRSLFWIAYLLGRSGEPAALTPLLELVNHSSDDVRASVAEALGRLGDPTAVTPLLEMLHDKAWFVRLHASRSLADLAATSTIPLLQEATRDPSWWVRNSAVESLRRLQATA